MRSQAPDKLLAITLQEDVAVLEEVVVVGYGTQKKPTVVGAIGTAKVDDIQETG
ncbi:MAG: hypothetical protein MZV63_10155 [Marinilabiliales bacterium]|nr:hypothetical protein [Marinilabiliales bacterium]